MLGHCYFDETVLHHSVEAHSAAVSPPAAVSAHKCHWQQQQQNDYEETYCSDE